MSQGRPAVRRWLRKGSTENRVNAKSRIDILRNCSFLKGAETSILEALAEETDSLTIPAGQTIITKGDTGSTMYFISGGTVRVHDGAVTLAELGEGEVIGEMAVLDSDVRSASVTTEKEVILLSLERDDLWRVISRSPAALKAIIAAVLQRERNIVQDVTTRTAQLQAFEKELEIGRRIQSNFLPESVPQVENWEISSYFEAAREVAGDFFDVFELKPDKRLAIVIGDVCDKGVGAALFMTLFRSLIRASCQYSALNQEAGKTDDSSAEHVRDILSTSIDFTNRYVATTHSKSSMFASVFFGVLDPRDGKLLYINGGHESPIIFKPGGEREILEVTGGILGLFPFAQYSISATQLDPGDLLFAYTDGINEAKNEQGDQFSDDRIFETGETGWNNSEEFVARMLEQVRQFRGKADQSDDITMLALRNLAGD